MSGPQLSRGELLRGAFDLAASGVVLALSANATGGR